MLISRTITQDKRVVTYFRHLNMRIAKNSLSFVEGHVHVVRRF